MSKLEAFLDGALMVALAGVAVGLMVAVLWAVGFLAWSAIRDEKPVVVVHTPQELPAGKVLMRGCAGFAQSVLIELENGRQECHQFIGGATR